MTVEFKEIGEPITEETQVFPVKVKLGAFHDDEDTEHGPSPTIMLEIAGIEFPFMGDEAKTIARALDNKARVMDELWRLNEDHCRDCVDQMIAEFDPDEPSATEQYLEGIWNTKKGSCDD